MATQASQNISNLFKELNRLGKDGDYEKALKVANKLVTELPDDEKAFQCKIVCLIQLGKYEEALSAIKKNTKFQKSLSFEKAFCEYRLNRCDQALKTIEGSAVHMDVYSDPRFYELLAQLYYRTEDYARSFDKYQDIIERSEDDFENERNTNLSAALAAIAMGKWEGIPCDDISLEEDMYELLYNSACKLIGERAFAPALEKLKLAEEMCRFVMADDDASEDEVNSELSIIWVQMGFVLQKLGKNEEALKLYNQVIKQKPNDAVLMAVASNNIITLNKDQNMFDSKKRIKAATSADVKNKLPTRHKECIAINECLLYMYGGQAEPCKKLADELLRSKSTEYHGHAIHVAQMMREKRADDAVEYLQSHFDLKLLLAQIYLHQERVYKACDVLKKMRKELLFTPGVVSTLVSLYLSQEDREMAGEILEQAVEWLEKHEPNSENFMKLVQAAANFHLTSGSPKVAAEMLEKMRRANPSDKKVVAQLLLAYSKFDSEKVKEISKEFATPKELTQDVDIDSLESSASWLGNKWAKRATKTEASPMSPKMNAEVVVKKKSKKKKKVLPKNYDPNVIPDPERWLPLRERSTYKGKKKNKKRDVGRGTQGAVAVGVSELDASEQSHNDIDAKGDAHSSPQGNGPRQQKPAAAAKQKPKKKKGRW